MSQEPDLEPTTSSPSSSSWSRRSVSKKPEDASRIPLFHGMSSKAYRISLMGSGQPLCRRFRAIVGAVIDDICKSNYDISTGTRITLFFTFSLSIIHNRSIPGSARLQLSVAYNTRCFTLSWYPFNKACAVLLTASPLEEALSDPIRALNHAYNHQNPNTSRGQL
jgi:hypothetical protein